MNEPNWVIMIIWFYKFKVGSFANAWVAVPLKFLHSCECLCECLISVGRLYYKNQPGWVAFWTKFPRASTYSLQPLGSIKNSLENKNTDDPTSCSPIKYVFREDCPPNCSISKAITHHSMTDHSSIHDYCRCTATLSFSNLTNPNSFLQLDSLTPAGG